MTNILPENCPICKIEMINIYANKYYCKQCNKEFIYLNGHLIELIHK
jgi:transposase-like protein